jgi:hypothetical protein
MHLLIFSFFFLFQKRRRLLPNHAIAGTDNSSSIPLRELTLPLMSGNNAATSNLDADDDQSINQPSTVAPTAPEDRPREDTTQAERRSQEGVDTAEHFARQIMMLMKPVSVCMVLVVYLVRTVGQSQTSGGFRFVLICAQIFERYFF